MKYQTLSGLLALLLLAGCSSSKKVIPDVPPSVLYNEAQTALQTGQWTTATEKLEALDSRYPFGAYSDQVQLDLIYAYYKSDDYALSLATISRFKRLNPTYKNMDWVIYMSGLNHTIQDSNFMQDFFDLDRSDRDPVPVRAAFRDFKELLQRYPNSVYAADAKQRLFALKNRLAKYDLAVADFYLRRKAWIAAIKRAQELQKTFPDTQAAKQSLSIQLKAYQALNLPEPIERTQALIELNNAES